MDAGALAAIVNALLKHTSTASLNEQGVSALRLLTKGSKPYRAMALEAGAKPEWLRTPSSGMTFAGSWTTSKLSGLGLSTRWRSD